MKRLYVPTIASTIVRLRKPSIKRLEKPDFHFNENQKCVFLGVASMKNHMTSEGWQITKGLESAGYVLFGNGLTMDSVDVKSIVSSQQPGTVVVQDKREWDTNKGEFYNPEERFAGINCLSSKPDIFRLTILKDAHQNPRYHSQAAEEMGCHAWISYYHPQIVSRVAPYTRPQHIVRTYHSIDREDVPEFAVSGRRSCIVSGAVSRAYPFREKIFRNWKALSVDPLRHPGYHRKGSSTHEYMKTLSSYAVSICTASIYGYALRKIIESTACGCRVITDLPEDDILPGIDGNLIRVSPQISIPELADVIKSAVEGYSPAIQKNYSDSAVEFYEYTALGRKLACDVEALRERY